MEKMYYTSPFANGYKQTVEVLERLDGGRARVIMESGSIWIVGGKDLEPIVKFREFEVEVMLKDYQGEDFPIIVTVEHPVGENVIEACDMHAVVIIDQVRVDITDRITVDEMYKIEAAIRVRLDNRESVGVK